MKIIKNLPYWTPFHFSYRKTGVLWYKWFLWFWIYRERDYFQKCLTGKKFYCFRIFGWQFEID